MKMIKANYQHKEDKRKVTNKKKTEVFKQRKQNDELKRLQRQKELKRQVFRTINKMSAENKDSSGKGKRHR